MKSRSVKTLGQYPGAQMQLIRRLSAGHPRNVRRSHVLRAAAFRLHLACAAGAVAVVYWYAAR